MIVAGKSQSDVEAVFDIGTTGLAGTAKWRIDDNQGATVSGPSALDIAEIGASGIYVVTFTAPGTEGQFSILFSEDATFDEGAVTSASLLVTEAEPTSTLPPLVPSEGAGPGVGPCSAWTTVEDVAECCANGSASDNSIYDAVVVESSQVLYELSGRRYAGLCERTVRPCRTPGASCFPQRARCGCRGLSEIGLAGRPIRSIVEVKIDGAVIDPVTYQLARGKIVRVRDPDEPNTMLRWPACQQLDLPDTEEDTFSIRYTHGADPPVLGQRAAAELACELYKACPGTLDPGQCALPAGVVRIVRQNATIDFRPFLAWAYDTQRGWQTGLRLVDLFLATYNPNGQRRRPAVWSPDVAPFPQAEPIAGS